MTFVIGVFSARLLIDKIHLILSTIIIIIAVTTSTTADALEHIAWHRLIIIIRTPSSYCPC